MVEHDEHPSKTAAWRDGEFVVLPDAESEDCTIWVAVEEHSGGTVKWEGLLARRLGHDRARVCAVPFWVYDLNLGDEVTIMESAEGAPVVTGIAVDAGNYTFRAYADEPSDDGWWRRLMVDLEPFKCWFDVRTPGLVAVSAPPDHAQAVANYLHGRQQQGELHFETGRSHPRGDR